MLGRPWSLDELLKFATSVQKYDPFHDKYVPAKPDNSEKAFIPLHRRVHRAWLVFKCEADVFIWPEDEIPKK